MVRKESNLGLLIDLHHVVQHVSFSGDQVYVVCPDFPTTVSCAGMLVPLLPAGVKFSGRTSVFDNGGRITVACAVDWAVMPEDDFQVVFVGWTKESKTEGMQQWQKTATRTLHLND